MKKLIIPILIIWLLVLSGCSDKCNYATSDDLSKEISLIYSTIDRNETLMNEKIDDLENIILNTWIIENNINIISDNLVYCHQRKDIKLWDNIYFPYLWNWDTEYLENQQWIKYVIIDWQRWYYDIQPVLQILWEIIEWENCITMINWYWTDPQKTYNDMIKHIERYIKCNNIWCNE